MSCENKSQPPSPLSILSLTASRVAALDPDAGKERIEATYLNFRAALMEVIMTDYAPSRFEFSLATIRRYADPGLDQLFDLPEGSADYRRGVGQLKELVKQRYENAPWN